MDMARSVRQPQNNEEAQTQPALKLIESERRLLHLIDNAKLGMVMIDQMHKVVETNQRFADMLGYSRDEVMNLHTWDWEAVTPKQEIKETYSDLSQIDFSIETKHRRKDGSLFDVEVSGIGVKLSNAPGDNAILCFCNDISERKKAERKLSESEKKFKSFVENAADIIFTVNTKCEVEYISPNCEKIIGYSSDKLTGKSFLKLFESEGRLSFLSDIKAAFKGEIRPGYEYKIQNKDNGFEWFSIKLSVIDDSATGKPLLICNTRNINERIENEKKLEYLSMHDQLTGIYNRLFFYEQLQRMDQQNLYPLSVLTFDLDELKSINDNHGHLTGDEVLIQCAQMVGTSLRKNDVFARVGGDEFSVILPTTSEEDADVLAQRIIKLIARNNKNTHLPPISISMGISTKVEPSVPIKIILSTADKRMYQEKRNKKAGAAEHRITGQSQSR